MKIALVAGEASGDAHGAALMEELQKKLPNITFSGAGGPKMEAISLHKGFDDWIAEAGVVGLWDVIKKYGYFRKKFSALLKQLEEEKPEAIILIDYAGFNLRLAKAIRRRKLPLKIIKYISPQVWAWNRRRIPEMARNLDLMICIFPFEEKVYEASGLLTNFSGHPLVEKLMALQPKLEREERLLGLFPGSRSREVHHIFPVMAAAAKRVIAENSTVRCEAAAATAAHAQEMKTMASKIHLPITITVGQAHSLMQRATFGLVCSGTATLEAAALGLPYALVYKATPLTAIVARALIKVPYLGIINILAGRPVVKEFLQGAATPQALAQEASHFLEHQDAALQLSRDVMAVAATLRSEGAYEKAAEAITKELIATKEHKDHTKN
ncbi:MAG: lipid-A-disaccharide synthase [Verrucomicrobiae bacterium]|nr:lipid-A-disaccharide synthase [Verrucomicrobiae bacterium]